MDYTAGSSPEYWAVLVTFFTIFAVFGLIKKPRSTSQCIPCIILGVFALAGNSALLILANRIGYGNYDVLNLLSLKQAAVESSFIIIGYCLILHGLGIFLRSLFAPPAVKAWRTFF